MRGSVAGWGLRVLLGLAVMGLGASSAVAALPDGRRYELVSPPQKNGADVMASSANTHAAEHGDAVVFSSLGAFGAVVGASAQVEYVARRTGTPGTPGWSTHAITPKQGAQTILSVVNGLLPVYEAPFTPDLSRGVYRTWRTLAPAPNVDDAANLYLREGLLDGNGTSELLTDAIAPVPINPNVHPWVAGASRSLDAVIFESPFDLTADAGGNEVKLYESVDGRLSLAGRIPAGSATACDDTAGPACVAAPSSQAGLRVTTGHYTDSMISPDGSRVFFQAPDGGGAGDGGKLYMRVDGTATVQINASEKTFPEAPRPARLWYVSADGKHAFFITGEGLVNGDDDGIPDVYMYDADAPAGARLTRLSEDSELADAHYAEGVVGSSADGRYVYFICDGQLVPGEPTGLIAGLYLWHGGALRYIGSFRDVPDAVRNSPGTLWVYPQGWSTARITPDGQHLLFVATDDAGFRDREGFAGYDHGTNCTFDHTAGGPCREVYIYTAQSNRLVCASCNSNAPVAAGDALVQVRRGMSVTSNTWHSSHALSDDGTRAFFNTTEALVPEDSNGKFDAYEYDVPSGTVHLISSGKDSSDSYFLDASANGDDVFFVTREQLVRWDVDQNYDLYDARVGGGFPEPVLPAPDCIGDTCQGQPSAAPAPRLGASFLYRGRGNAAGKLKKRRHARTRRCARKARTGAARKKRCARKRRHRHAAHAKHAKHGRSAR